MSSAHRFGNWPKAAALLVSVIISAASQADQRQALAVANELLIYVHEGIGDQAQIVAKLNELKAPGDATAEQRASYEGLRQNLTEILNASREGRDISWATPRELSTNIRGILSSTDTTQEYDRAVALEFLALQYIANSYLGVFELAPEQPNSLVSMNEAALIQLLDSDPNYKLGGRFHAKWTYLKFAIVGREGESSNWRYNTDVPIVVYKGTRTLIDLHQAPGHDN